jgi:hypothetical protein
VEQVVSACGLEKDSQTGAAQLRVQFNATLLGMCRRSFLAIYIQKRSFHQDRLGTNTGKRHNKDRFLSGGDKISLTNYSKAEQARKRHFLRHLYIKCIILPRQARDKHRENSKKCRFLAGICDVRACGKTLP